MDYLGLDHLVFTVQSIEKTLSFYTQILGFKEITFGEGRKALQCGQQKINLHEVNKEFKPHAKAPTPGAIDLCVIAKTSLTEVKQHLSTHSVPIIEGPIERTGAQGKILSLYIRDPDENLIEISNYL